MKRIQCNRAIRKLRSRAGETIGETLVALLISSLALVMLAGAISSAAKIITRSETVMDTYYQGLNALGQPSNTGLTVTLNDDTKTVILMDGEVRSISVKYFPNTAFASKPVISYSMTD